MVKNTNDVSEEEEESDDEIINLIRDNAETNQGQNDPYTISLFQRGQEDKIFNDESIGDKSESEEEPNEEEVKESQNKF